MFSRDCHRGTGAETAVGWTFELLSPDFYGLLGIQLDNPLRLTLADHRAIPVASRARTPKNPLGLSFRAVLIDLFLMLL